MPDSIEWLQAAAGRFTNELSQLTDEQWLAAPPGGGWSPSEITEHVTIATRTIAVVLDRRLAPLAGAPPAVLDDEIPFLFYRGDEPPEVATPTGTWRDRVDGMAQLRASVTPLVEWANGVDVDLRTVGTAHPAFGLLDGVQWLLFTGAHLERHRAQLIGLR